MSHRMQIQRSHYTSLDQETAFHSGSWSLIQIDFEGESKQLKAEEIAAIILRERKLETQAYVRDQAHNAVIAVPAHFDDVQRQATKIAGTIAGWNVLRIVNEPVAAAIAYDLNYSNEERRCLIFDHSAKALTVTLLTIEEGIFEVTATARNEDVGGESLDRCLVEYCLQEILKRHGKDLTLHKQALHRLHMACEEAKQILSGSSSKTRIQLDSLHNGIDFHLVLTRERFEDLCRHHFEKSVQLCQKILLDAAITKTQVDDIILVGGSTHIPKIQQMITTLFDGKEPLNSINPQEVVAHGATIVAKSILSPGPPELEYLDYIPLSYGLETVGGIIFPMIKRNTVHPFKKSQIFTTHLDNQTSVLIAVFQGERAMTKDNTCIAYLRLDDIPPMPRGQPQIEVTFDISGDYNLVVSAEEKISGKKTGKMRITDTGRVTQDGINAMIENAEKCKGEDESSKKRVGAKNRLEYYCYTLQSLAQEQEQILPQQDKENNVKETLTSALQLLDNNTKATMEEYEEKSNEIESFVHRILQSNKRLGTARDVSTAASVLELPQPS